MSRRLYLIVALLLGSHAQALELGLTLGSQTEYTNNATFSREDKQEEVEQLFSVDFSAVETRKDFELDAEVNLDRRSYFNNVYEDETSVSTGFGLLNFNIIESFLTWETSLTRSQELKDPFGPELEDNLDRRDVFETGPSVFYGISETEQMYFSSMYINAENSDPDLADTERSDTQAGYIWSMDSLTQSTISLGYENIIKPDGARDYDEYSASVGLTRQIAGGSVSLSAGLSKLEDKEGLSETSNTYSFLLQKQNVFNHGIFVSYDESISDTSLGFQPIQLVAVEANVDPDAPADTPQPSLVLVEETVDVNSVVKRRTFGLGISRDLSNIGYSLSFSWAHERAIDIYDVEYGKGVAFEVEGQIARNMSLSYEVDFEKESSKTQFSLSRDRTLEHSVSLSYDLTETFSVSSSCAYNQQKDENDLVTEEMSLNVGLVWTVL